MQSSRVAIKHLSFFLGMKHPLVVPAILTSLAGVVAAADLSEKDYFSELPEVLTVTRLAQPLSETPGAVTIIDREAIRRSGARELVDVLQLVPGYMVGGFNGANRVAAYHAPIDSLGVRNLILVDGRSIYSSYYNGGTQLSMMGVLIEDIERIEVLRGSNSAAYGANAMFGVINIITRHAADTHGASVSFTAGENGVWDNMARFGWGDATGSYRLSAGRRGDSGYRNAHDDKLVSNLNLRADLRPTIDQDVMLAAGISQTATGDGFSASAGNPLRTVDWHDFYLHGQWRRQLSETGEIKLSANYDEETFGDDFVYAPDPSVSVGVSGRGRRLNLELQHQVGITPELRGVWGAGYKFEEARSYYLYSAKNTVEMHEERLFGNLEWRPHRSWLVNAGGFLGNHSWTGSYFSPRLMVNFLATPDHTFRAGLTKSARMPTLFELAADVTYHPRKGPPPFSLATILASLNMPYHHYAASGNLQPERLRVEEVGYFGNFRDWRMTLDVRGYIEKMSHRIDTVTRYLPGYSLPLALPPPYGGMPIPVIDFTNYPGFETHGLEYQLRWEPVDGTEIWLNQSVQRLKWDRTLATIPDISPPERTTTIALFQKLPHNLDLYLMFNTMTSMSWGSNAIDRLPARHQIDARIAKSFHIGSTKAEAAFTVNAADGGYPEYLLTKGLTYERRAYGTLRLEF